MNVSRRSSATEKFSNSPSAPALKFCFKTCVAMKFVDDDDDDDDEVIKLLHEPYNYC